MYEVTPIPPPGVTKGGRIAAIPDAFPHKETQMSKNKKSVPAKNIVDSISIGGGFTMDVIDTPKEVEIKTVPVPSIEETMSKTDPKKSKKSKKPKNPTADQLTVASPTEPKNDVITEGLKEMYASAIQDPGYALVRVFEEKTGKPWWTCAEKGETLNQFMFRTTVDFVKGKDRPAPVQTQQTAPKPTTVPQTSESAIKTEKTPVIAKEKKVVAPRGDFFGHAATSIFRWMGANNWSKEEAMKAMKELKWEGSEATANIHLNAGKKGGDCGGRGVVPVLTVEDVAKLEVAAGRTNTEAPVVIVNPKTSKKSK